MTSKKISNHKAIFFTVAVLITPILFLLSACNAASPLPRPAPTSTFPPPSPTIDTAKLQKELLKAINDNKADDVARLLDAGIDVNVIAKNAQQSYLSLAAYEGNIAILTLILDHGADVAMSNINEYRTTPLIEAAQNGKLEAVTLLIERGADVNQRDKAGDPALNWATYYGHKEVVQFLIEQGATLTVVGSGGGTALNTAIARGHKEIEQILRDAGATE